MSHSIVTAPGRTTPLPRPSVVVILHLPIYPHFTSYILMRVRWVSDKLYIVYHSHRTYHHLHQLQKHYCMICSIRHCKHIEFKTPRKSVRNYQFVWLRLAWSPKKLTKVSQKPRAPSKIEANISKIQLGTYYNTTILYIVIT